MSFDSPDEVEAAFYAAFSSADIQTIKEVWADSPQAVCVHPMSAPLYGFAAILESWSNILGHGGGKISHQTLYRRQEGNLAIHGIEERLMLPQGVEARIHSTHVYIYAPKTGWKLLIHHASPVPGPVNESTKEKIH